MLGALCVTLVKIFISKSEEEKRQSTSLLMFMILPVLSAVLNSFYYGISFLWAFTSMLLVMIHLDSQQKIINDEKIMRTLETEKVARMEAELAQSRISIMLSQIQPHFLYNVLCVIQDLCYGKAPEAEQATIEFSEFLRGNLDSLGATKPITFEQELKHTQNYLSLEKRRFGQRLNVIYDINITDFMIPALTLQPIVENAVRYGVLYKESGGTVWISANDDGDNYIITVKDDGVGFDITQKKNDGRTHIGIENVRERLEKMSGGSLAIESIKGKGTKAEIKIPKQFSQRTTDI